MIKKACFYIVCLLPVLGWGQKTMEIGLVSDNDLYTSPVHDRYYTNGIEFFCRFLVNSDSEKLEKLIAEVKAGQYMYNPQSVAAANINVNDRPFAGYLFAEIGANAFYKSQNILKINFQAGIVGKESLAEDFQESLHKLLNYPAVRGWEHQIRTTFGFQANAFYVHKIFKERYKEKVDLYLQADVNAGTIWTGISAGPMMRISLKRLLLPIYDSNLYGASVSNKTQETNEQREFYLFINPNVNYQLYDATIEGSMFNNDSPVTFPLVPWRFNAEVGVKYRKNNWNLSYAFNYRSKELKNNVITGYYYGSIVVGYLL